MNAEEKPKVAVYCLSPTTRLRYVLGFLTGSTGFEWIITQNANEAVVVYGASIATKILIPNEGLLENGVRKVAFISWIQNNRDAFECAHWEKVDVFTWIFYWISRIEEYDLTPEQKDEHGRCSPFHLLPTAFNWWDKPQADIAALWLEEQAAAHLGGTPTSRKSVLKTLTLDIDQSWVFKQKGFQRNMGGLLKDALHLRFNESWKRMKHLLGIGKDPFDVFTETADHAMKHQFNLLFFWLLGDASPHDRNIDFRNTFQHELITKIGAKFPIGIHPSYDAGSNNNKAFDKIKIEKQRLENILKEEVIIGRPHFLRFSIPDSLNYYEDAGITEFHGMGWAHFAGFRAGTAYDYFWYDINQELITNLRICSFMMMDVTLKDYLKLQPEQAIEKGKDMIQELKKTGGHFRLLWHNESLSGIYGWKGWERVPLEILD